MPSYKNPRSHSKNRSRSRSPHVKRQTSTTNNDNNARNLNSPTKKNPESEPIWKQRRMAAESNDYSARQLSPARLSPYRSLSPNRSKKNSECNSKQISETLSWADETNLMNEETELYLEREERALAGLENYKKNMSRISPNRPRSVSPYKNNKENQSPKSSNPNSKNRNRSKSNPRPRFGQRKIIVEEDPDILIRRQKDIDYGKNQEVYSEYLRNVEKEDRTNQQPWTPDKYEKMTRRNWDKQVKIWRKQLHHWKEPLPVDQLLTPGTSPCPSPNRRLSPPRFVFGERANDNKNNSAKTLFAETDDNAMTGFDSCQPIISSIAKSTLDNSDMMEDNSNSCMSMQDNVVVPSAFR